MTNMKVFNSVPTTPTYELYADMLKQTHILVAGQTGSGKSVVINGIITTAIHKVPAEVGLILIDPKRVELVEYKKLPHTMYYASEPDDMVRALEFAMGMCDSRYKAMQELGMKKYTGSHIYVIIDELADLMTTDKKRVMPLIQRLCQVGRAAGISVIAATQCPLAAVIPTPIKVNFDTKVALKTQCAQHSRNIMEANGCEVLPRYGKAYYINPDRNGIVNVPMYTDDEREAVTGFWFKAMEAKRAEARKAEAPRQTPRKPVEAPRKKGLFARLFA